MSSSALKVGIDILHIKAAFLYEHHEMIEKIAYLKGHFIVNGVFCGYDGLSGFLADLFKYLVNALIEQVIGIGTFFGMLVSVGDGSKNIVQHACAAYREPAVIKGVFKAGEGTVVAGRTALLYMDKEGISFTVCGDAVHPLHMAAGLSLKPKRLP